MTLLKGTLLLIYIGTFGSFAWGIKYFFKTHGGKPKGVVLIEIAGGLSVALQLYLIAYADRTSNLSVMLAAALLLASTFMFWWTVSHLRNDPPTLAFSSDKPARIYHRGPYSLVRHPFYCSYMLAWFAGGFACRSINGFLPVVIMFPIYWRAAVREEEKFRCSDLQKEYADYSERVGRFFPLL